MNWETNVSQSGFDSASGATSIMGSRSDQRSGVGVSSNNNTGFMWSTVEMSGVVGMKVSAIGAMTDAITAYCDDIKAHLDGIDPNANASGAYKSKAVQDAVRAYIEKVKEYAINLTSQLMAFNDKIRDVRNQWLAATGNIAGQVGSTAGSYAQGTKYTDQIQ